jgi:hypothetical protein
LHALVPEYLAPGVYVEEVSYRARSIAGVPTSAVGFLALGVLVGVGLAVLVDRAAHRRCGQTREQELDGDTRGLDS